jgi:cytochrome c
LPDENFSSVIDMQFGPDGDLYFLEYGSAWFKGNANSALVRIEYNGGNRKPKVEASADKTAAAVPFKVNLSSKGTIDYDKYDKDALKYEWKITGNGFEKTVTDADPSVTLDKPGPYTATLTVTDTKGEKNSKSIPLIAGNEPPSVTVTILKGNKTFFFPNEPIEYSIDVSDKEDGNVASGTIQPAFVAVNFDYVPQGFDPIEISQHHRSADERTGFAAGLYLMNASDCKSCHMLDKTSVGPSFIAVSEKYKNDQAAVHKLADKVISGGSGVWGEHAMAAHPTISQQDAETIVKYILSVAQKPKEEKSLPLKGVYVGKIPAGEKGNGGYLLRAAYKDKGANGVEAISSESIVALRSSVVDPQKADEQKSTQLLTTPYMSFSLLGDRSYIGYHTVDLTGIKEIDFLVQATPSSGDIGGSIEVHLDSPDGKLIGQTGMVESKELDFARIMEMMGGKAKPKNGPAKADTTRKQQAAEFDFSMLQQLLGKHAMTSIAPVEGMHNIYFVFRNRNAKSKQPLMEVTAIHFKNTASPPVTKK